MFLRHWSISIGQYIVVMVDVAAIKRWFHSLAPFLDERGRRLVLDSEVAAAGRGSLKAVAAATGVARSTIGRGLGELRTGRDVLGDRVRRPGAGRKPGSVAGLVHGSPKPMLYPGNFEHDLV